MDCTARARSIILQAEADCASAFTYVDKIERANTEKVLDAFIAEGISARHFAPTTGYGYDDIGRDSLERVFARAFGCEDALVRPSVASGTHALAISLFGLLRPNETVLAVTGKPYDTLESVIGITPSEGSLAEWGVRYKQVDLLADGSPDFDAIREALRDKSVRVAIMQRSRGYDWRASLSVETLGALCACVHEARPDVRVMVDNCYGEFVEREEPTSVGADLIVGSLIKNPGGGYAPTGGYIAGKADCIERVSKRLIAPGIGREVGSWAAGYAPFYQGLFHAPHAAAQAVKSSILTARTFEIIN